MCASGFSCHYRKFPQTHADMPKHLCIPITTGKVSSRVKDARSKERPLSSTSQPANIANGDFTPEETDARTVITSFDTLRWGTATLMGRSYRGRRDRLPLLPWLECRMPGEDNNIAQPASRIPVKEPTSPSIDGDRDVISSVAKIRRN